MTKLPVYIIHPLKGKGSDHQDNMVKVMSVCRYLTINMPEILPVCPILNFIYLDDNSRSERDIAIESCFELIKAVAKAGGEAWVFGDYQDSEGCLREIPLAGTLGMKIRYLKIPLDREQIAF